MLQDEIKSRFASNVVQSNNFSGMLANVLTATRTARSRLRK